MFDVYIGKDFNVDHMKQSGLEHVCVGKLQPTEDVYFRNFFMMARFLIYIYIGKMINMKFMKVSGLAQVFLANCLVSLWKNV